MSLTLLPKLALLAAALVSGVLGHQGGMVCFKDSGAIVIRDAAISCCDDDRHSVAKGEIVTTNASALASPITNSKCVACVVISERIMTSRTTAHDDESQAAVGSPSLTPLQYGEPITFGSTAVVFVHPLSAFPPPLSFISLRC